MRILIIENDKGVCSFVKSALKSRAFVVDTAEDGEQGLSLALINEYDLIILDSELPKKSGFDVCQEVRQHGKDVPILVLSTNSGIKSKTTFLGRCGADDYLIKPFSIDELLLRTKVLLRRHNSLPSTVLECGGLVLDMRKHKVTRGGREIYLTRKEYGVLRYLLVHKGSLLSQIMIFEHVWDMNADQFSNTVEAHIGSLRKKLGDKDKTLIRTVPGRGYQLECLENQCESENSS